MALANTLTGLIPTIYAARDVISRELTGLIPAVSIDSSAQQAAVDQTIRIEIAPPMVSVNIVPAMTPPTPDSQPMSYVDMKITKSKAVQIPWNGEEQLSVSGSGPGVPNIMRDQMAQAMRTLVNEVEADLAANYIYFSRAYGTAGTTPFATNLGDPAQVRKILDDNGAPLADRQLVINTSAGAALRTLAQLTKVNEAGTDVVQRRGTLINIHDFDIRESGQIKLHTKGTGASYVTSGSTAVNIEDIALVTGTGTVLAGDVVTFAADTANKYIVTTGVAAPGTISLAEPGARVVIATANALTVGNGYSANMAFSRSAMILLARAPALPGGRDQAVDRTQVSDPNTGLTFTVALYMGYHQMFIEVSLAWGTKCIKPQHTAILLG